MRRRNKWTTLVKSVGDKRVGEPWIPCGPWAGTLFVVKSKMLRKKKKVELGSRISGTSSSTYKKDTNKKTWMKTENCSGRNADETTLPSQQHD